MLYTKYLDNRQSEHIDLWDIWFQQDTYQFNLG